MNVMTEKLYYIDAYQKEFEAVVTGCEKREKGYVIYLNRTCFYPEGGGQPCDLGQLFLKGERATCMDKEEGNLILSGCCTEQERSVEVYDVQEEAEKVAHFCKEAIDVGTVVTGRIDWNRRLKHMREHSGEHIISGILCETYGLHNVGFHMSKEFITIDLDGVLSWEQVLEAEKKANAVVMQNVEIQALYPEKEILKTMYYRSKKELEGQVRIVRIPNADVCACCGTHVKQSGEIGMIKVVNMENFRKGIRLTLLIGEKAYTDYVQKQENIKRIGALLSVKPEKTGDAVQKLWEDFNQLKLDFGALKMQVLEQKAQAIELGSKSAILFEEGLSALELRKLAEKLAERANFSAVFCGNDVEGYKYVICDNTRNITEFGKRFNVALHGKGGGRDAMIQGSVVASRLEIEQFLVQEI